MFIVFVSRIISDAGKVREASACWTRVCGDRESVNSVNKSAASTASPEYVKFRAVVKSAASAPAPRGGRTSDRTDHGLFFACFFRASGQKICKISDSVNLRLIAIEQVRLDWTYHDETVSATELRVVGEIG